jgi:hypothetical protein
MEAIYSTELLSPDGRCVSSRYSVGLGTNAGRTPSVRGKHNGKDATSRGRRWRDTDADVGHKSERMFAERKKSRTTRMVRYCPVELFLLFLERSMPPNMLPYTISGFPRDRH